MAEGGEEADDKVHDPTQRRLEEAAKKGDVPRSIEVNTWFILSGLALTLALGAGAITQTLSFSMRGFLEHADLAPANGLAFRDAARAAMTYALVALSIPLGVAMVAALAGSLVQNRPNWTTQPLAPQLSRISPLAGFKRVFGKEAIVQFLKGLLKIAIVGALGTMIFWSEKDRLEAMVRNEVADILPITLVLSLKMLGGMLALFTVVALADYLYQRFTWFERNRMTTRELKDEFKDTEGNPEIKAKLRQIRAAKARTRKMQALPTATVVITNPTHFAVALKYERGMAAPICVANGVDSLALRIREVAAEHDVPVVESPPLARALHAAIDIDDEIPVEHFKAVAEIIGYVLRLRRGSQ